MKIDSKSYSIEDSILKTAENAQKKLNSALQQISTGSKINSASDDAAGLALSEQISSSSREADQTAANSQMEKAMTQVADSGLSQISDNLQQIRGLALKAANGTNNAQDRQAIQDQINQLQQDNDQVAQNTTFNDKKLLDGSAAGTQVMATEKEPTTIKEAFNNASTASLGIDNVDVSTPEKALALVQKTDNAQETINQRRTELGTVSNALDDNIERSQVKSENLSATNSTIRDTDIAKGISDMVNAKITMSAAVAMQSQANSTNKTVLGLLHT